MAGTTEETHAEANRLYWETDTSVADIATQLDISRRALYGAVEPVLAGQPCPVCGGELTFENRSARAAEHATCTTCGAEADLDEIESEPAESERSADVDATVRLGAAALVGVAVGALLTLTVLPRR